MTTIKHFPPPPGVTAPPLSFGARVGDLLFISGIPGFDASRELPDGFEAQFANVVTNFKRVLTEAGATMRDLVKVNVLLTRASDVATMNVLYAGAFAPRPIPRAPPASWWRCPIRRC
ncbi:2-iminobutanoate/2-iminopropanoate deaminase [Bradyrhizobium sp. USDA 3240]